MPRQVICEKFMNKSEKTYYIGIAWFILSLVCSNLNDTAVKYLVTNLPVLEVSFFRFFFGVLSLLPFMLYQGRTAFITPRLGIHILRGTLLFGAMILWVCGVGTAPLTVVTVLSFTVPMFVLILAPILLHEIVTLPLWVATCVGFIGALVVLDPTDFKFNPMSIVLLIASFMFALLDVINKKYVLKESMLSMLFYSALVTTMLAAPLAFWVWVTPSPTQLMILMLLGAGSNLILYCLLRAFALVNASAVAPVRYTELLISASMGYILFHEVPIWSVYTGSVLIIPATLFIAYQQVIYQRDQAQNR